MDGPTETPVEGLREEAHVNLNRTTLSADLHTCE